MSIVQPELSRQYFTSSVGLAEPWKSQRQSPLSHSFCQHVVRTADVLAVRDAHPDRSAAGDCAVEDLGVVSYLGAPIYKDAGDPIGALCVIGDQPRDWSPTDVKRLVRLASCVSNVVGARALVLDSQSLQRDLERASSRLTDAIEAGDVGLWERDLDTGNYWVSDKYDELHGGTTHSWTGLESLIAGFDLTVEREREDRIRALNSELAASNEDLGEFVRIASHDLRSPLRAISSLIQLLRHDAGRLPDSVERRLEQIDARANRMARLLDDLLAYLASGSRKTTPEEVDLADLARPRRRRPCHRSAGHRTGYTRRVSGSDLPTFRDPPITRHRGRHRHRPCDRSTIDPSRRWIHRSRKCCR